MPHLPKWPGLRTLNIDLWPRNPGRPHPEKHTAWGVQTEKLLYSLGVVSAVRANITLEMRWAADCERFERDFVERGRWRGIITGDEDGVQEQEGEFCRRCYELRGNEGPLCE